VINLLDLKIRASQFVEMFLIGLNLDLQIKEINFKQIEINLLHKKYKVMSLYIKMINITF